MRRRLAVWLVGSALLGATVFLVGCAVTATMTPILAAKHVAYAPGTACDAAGCHTPEYFHPTYTHKEPYLGPCDKCHNLVSWKRVTYKHKDAGFDNGMHPLLGCSTCHTEGKPLPGPECSACHESPHKGWTSCSSCHTTTAWRLFQPLPSGHLSLKGGHSKLACLDCHTAATRPAHDRQCVDCHGTNHGGLRNCQECHAPATGWEPKPGWSHSDFFVLRGAHKSLECAQCHKNDRFAGTPQVCVGCHGKKHGGLSDCAGCHTTSAFVPSTFRHSSVFTLTGAHDDLKCSRCHPDRAFARVVGGGSHACVACHGPQHGGLRDCAECHTTSSFDHPTFDHRDEFPLIGRHATLACSSCHPGNRFAQTISTGGTSCRACHAGDNPHGASVGACENCHTPLGFNFPKPFPDHPIPLGAAHRSMSCTLCHTSLVFSAPTRACVSCHSADIPHVGPTDCLSCHWPTTWDDTHFTHATIAVPADHNTHASTASGYPVECYKCHPSSDSPTNPDFTHHSCTITGCHLGP